jgi:hypothetical protein
MNFRKLRIAWSVLWGLAAALLIVLWVRSYTIHDEAWWPRSNVGFVVASVSGHILLSSEESSYVSEEISIVHEKIDPETTRRFKENVLGFVLEHFDNGISIAIPFWLPLLTIIATTVAPWIRWSKQFTLRTLLIATTLVALVLGAIVYAVR